MSVLPGAFPLDSEPGWRETAHMQREIDDAPAMNCRDTREGLPTFVSGGGMGVTELALVAAHLSQCGDCRRERESLEQMVASSRRRTASPRAVLQSLGRTIDAMRSAAALAAKLTRPRVSAIVGVTSLVDLPARRLPGLVTRAVGTSARVWEASGPLIAHLADLEARLRTWLMAGHRWAARSATEVARRGVTLALELLIRVRRTLPILSTRFGRIAAHVVGARRSVIPRALDALAWLHARLAPTFTVSRLATARTFGAGRVGAIWMADRLASGISVIRQRRGITRGEFLTPGDRASGTRPLLAACVGLVSLAILAVTIMSPRSPANRMPADTTATAPPTTASVSERISSPAGPAAPFEPKASRVARRAKRVEAEIPAPSRKGDPSVTGSAATPLAPIPVAEGVRSAEPSDAPDAFAAIDWLLRGGPGR
jgi:hypothetical protein